MPTTFLHMCIYVISYIMHFPINASNDCAGRFAAGNQQSLEEEGTTHTQEASVSSYYFKF